MRRLISLLTAVCLLAGLPMAGVSRFSALASEVVRDAPPDLDAYNGALLLDGFGATTEHLKNMEIVYAEAATALYVDLGLCDVDDITKLPSMLQSITIPYPANLNADGAFVIKNGNISTKPAAGDLLLLRRAATTTAPASEWASLVFDPLQLAKETAADTGDLPTVTLTADSAVLTPKNLYTEYEYALVPSGGSTDAADILWTMAGSAYASGGTDITVHFPASLSPYSFWVRVLDDDAAAAPISKTNGVTADKPYINYQMEVLGPLNASANGTVWFMAVGDKGKWTSITVESGDEQFFDLAKIFGKNDITIELRRYDLPPESAMDDIAEAAAPSPDGAVRIVKESVRARAILPKELKATGFVSKKFPMNWTLTGSTQYRELEYAVPGGSWQRMTLSEGLPLLTNTEQKAKVKASKYQIRVPANPKTKTPASSIKNFSQQKQTKNPVLKPNYKTEIVKVKVGTYYTFAEPGQNPETLKYKLVPDTVLDINDALNKGLALYVYLAENGNKSRSGYVSLRFAPRAGVPDEGQGLLLKAGKAKLDKGYEFYGSKEKWGAYKKGDTTGLVRVKPTAKYNSKSGTTTGMAASRPTKATIVYDDEGKVALSATVEPKATIDLAGWGIFTLTNGVEAYGSAAGKNAAPLIAPNTKDSTPNLVINPSFTTETLALMAGYIVMHNDTPLKENLTAHYYQINNLKIGDTITITTIPANPDICRVSVYTMTVIPPLMKSPQSTGMMTSAEKYGWLRISLDTALAPSESTTFVIELYKDDETEPYLVSEETIAYSAEKPRDYYYDYRTHFSAKGPGNVTVKVYTKETDGHSRSNPATSVITHKKEDFAPYTIVFEEPYTTKVGEIIRISAVLDHFGNNITEGLTYQWSRVSPNGVTTPVEQNGNFPNYMFTIHDVIHYMEVTAYGKEGEKAFRINEQILP